MQLRVTYWRSTVFVAVLAAFCVVLLHLMADEPGYAQYVQEIQPMTEPIVVVFEVAIAIAGILIALIKRGKPAETKMHTLLLFAATSSEWIYLASLAVLAGALLTLRI